MCMCACASTVSMPFWFVVLELSSQLDAERNEIQRLENEKREWLSRGVHAEFEKKDKVCTTLAHLSSS